MRQVIKYENIEASSAHSVQSYVKRVKAIGSFDADGLGRSIQSLYNLRYWAKERRRRRARLDELEGQFEELLEQCGHDESKLDLLGERLRELHATLLCSVSRPPADGAAPAQQPKKTNPKFYPRLLPMHR